MSRHVVIALFSLSLVLTAQLSGDAAADDEVRVLVSFKARPGRAERDAVRNRGGNVRHVYRLVPAVSARVPQSELAALRRDPRVDQVELDLQVHASDLELDNAWGVARIGAATAHGLDQRGSGVKVAVIDTGIDYTHPDLNGNYAGGWDFVNDDNDPMDDDGHGTHVAGTIAAEDDDAGAVGVAPEAELYALKVLDENGNGFFSDVIAAVEWCIANEIRVTNNSYGSWGDPGSIVRDAFDSAAAAGILMVAAAGNSGSRRGTGNTVEYPARYESVVAVAAVTAGDARASFSSTGPDVEVAAPGASIFSTVPGGGYAWYSGTSMACPHAAGAAAVLIGAGVVDAADLRFLLAVSAEDLGTAGRDMWYGHGLVDVASALSAVVGPPDPDPDPGVEQVHVESIAYSLSGGRLANRNLAIALLVLDDEQLPVPDAGVEIRVTRNGGTALVAQGVTDGSGLVVFNILNAAKGTYVTEVLDISADPLEWDGVTPANSFKK
jgi:subtilisin family serine protease